jgi:hypothetical protein
MAGHWEELDGGLYWIDPDDIYVPVDAMDDRDWEEAMT